MESYKSIILITVLLIFATLFVAHETENKRYGKQKVVYHINFNDANAQSGALRNAQNHINAVGKEQLDLIILMHGKGLSLLLKPEGVKTTKLKYGNATLSNQKIIARLKSQGVKFRVCANTLKSKGISYEKDLYDVRNEDVVPSGIAELTYLQQMGYSYIKP